MGKTLKIISLIVLVQGLSFLVACERRTSPVLKYPASAVSSVTGVCTQVDVTKFPENRAFLSIADQSAEPVTDFEIGNFSVVEDDKPVVVTDVKKVNNSADPLSIVMVLDRSGSMSGTPNQSLDQAATNFVAQLGVSDEVEIISFDNNVVVSQSFTTDHTLLNNAILNYADFGGMTALYDAIGRAVNDLSDRRGRKFILAMTDGMENASNTYTTVGSIIDFANSKGLSVFTVGLGYVDESGLQQLANDTGGRFFLATTPAGLNTAFQTALKQFNNEVEVHFRSLSSGSRRLKIYMNYGSFTGRFEKTYSD